MPDVNGELTEGEQRKVDQWLEKVTCPICRAEDNWYVHTQRMTMLPLDGQGNVLTQGMMLHVIPIICRQCGGLLNLSAQHAGIQ